jgi:uncharacterized caspase-like protein
MLDTTWHYGVVVGIDQYPKIEDGKLDLHCPIEDARRIQEWLTSHQGGNLASERVTTLTRTVPPGRPPPAPIFDEINAAILSCAADFLKRRRQVLSTEVQRKSAWQRSRFYFYISGHGMDGDGDDAVLITANATPDSLNHISTRNVLNRLKQDRVFGEIVIFADCCRELAAVPVQALPWNLSKYAGYNDPRLPRIFAAFASRNRTSAFEPPPDSPIKNSLFTQALLEGLEGGTPGNTVNSDNLKRFLYSRVPKLAEQTSKPDQYPEIIGDDDIEFGSTSKSYRVTLKARPGSIFDGASAVDAIQMEGGMLRARVTLPASAAHRFEGTLPTGYYAVVATGDDPLQSTTVHALRVVGEDVIESIG